VKKKNKFLITLIVGLCLLIHSKLFAFPCLYHTGVPPREIANLLGWVPTGTNLCGGYYKEPAIVLSCANPPDIDAATTTISAERTVSFSATGSSHLEGNIIVTQPGRKMTADSAYLYRDPKTHEIAQIHLQGNVHYYESGKHLVAQSVYVDLLKKYVKLDNALYRLAKPTRCQVLNAWGEAKCVIRKSENDICLTNASYTTCPPICPTWKVVASKLNIDRVRGWGEAINTYFYVHNMPLVWIPYFSFPVDKRRKTGFLFPTFAYTNNNGFHISFPYYLNLAPNYDATISPNYIYRRGIQFTGNLRYLTCHNTGNLHLEYIPYDSNFAYFRARAADVYGINPKTIPFLDRIHRDSNGRGMLSFDDCIRYYPHWWGNLTLNYVTDDYYLQDFAYNPFVSSRDQLLNEAQINYGSENWHFLGRILTYQTLHPINQQPILDQYSRIPQLYITSDYPEFPFRFNYQVNAEAVYFDRARDFVTGKPRTTGQRFHFQPSIDFPVIYPSSFFIPRLTLDATVYELYHEQDFPRHRTKQISRVLPIFDVDTGIYLERNLFCYKQTLEPHLFYLFVPETNQNQIPIFDTTLPPFGFQQLFRTNRFVGYDRWGDANQLSLALTTRLLDSFTGEQKLRASIGQCFYFKRPSVCLLPDCSNDFYIHKNLSPVVGELNYFFNSVWDGVVSVAVDPLDQGLNNASIQLHYRPGPRRIFNIGYDFVRKGDTLNNYRLNSGQDNLSRFNLALAWQLTDHWQAIGNLNYNLSHGHPQTYFYGFQYDSCCWAFRIVASRILTAENMNDLTTYQTNYYVQLQLKGLGNLGNNDPGNLLTSSIFGYQDTFRG
jgi:LPS-assembly protein